MDPSLVSVFLIVVALHRVASDCEHTDLNQKVDFDCQNKVFNHQNDDGRMQ